MNARPGRLIRPMRVDDLERVCALENLVFPAPWTRGVFASEIVRESSICLVCEQDGELVGYLVADLFVEVWHIMNICVHPAYRRQSIGSDLLEAYFQRTEGRRHRGHTLEVRVSNRPAIALYESFGFVASGVRRGYYSDNREDALIMWKDWEGSSA